MSMSQDGLMHNCASYLLSRKGLYNYLKNDFIFILSTNEKHHKCASHFCGYFFKKRLNITVISYNFDSKFLLSRI